MEIKAFLANTKHKHRASQCGEHDCSASSKNRRDYYEYLSLSHFMMNFNHKENGRKKSFSSKSKGFISRILI